MENLTFSLIVPTVNRSEELRTLFISLQGQTFQNFEIIVVDQNEDNRVLPIINEFKTIFKIHHIRQGLAGASAARNAGRAHATGSIITFPDDDCEYPDNVLKSIFELFTQHPELDGITCSSKSKSLDGSIARFSNEAGPITKFNVLKKMVEFTIFVKSKSVEGIYFDENFGPGSKSQCWADEGPDLILRMMNRGARFYYFPHIIIYHPNPVKIYNEKTLSRSFKYGCARGKYLKKHHYPFWFVLYVWGLYVAGMMIGVSQLNWGKIKYYYLGLRGRIQGFIG
jgi:glycosyltransferase involved in cell wall biosynthesis